MTASSAAARPASWASLRLAITGLALISLAAILLMFTLARIDRPTLAVVSGGVALGAYAAGLLCLLGAAWGGDLGLVKWRFAPWVLLWYSLAFGLATITWRKPQVSTSGQIVISDVLGALGLVAIGITFLTVGYLVGPGCWARRRAARAIEILGQRFAGEVRSSATPWLLYLIGVAARLVNTATTGLFGYVGDVSSSVTSVSGYGQILGLLSLCAPLALCAAALQVYRDRIPGARITLAVLFVVEIIFGAASGGKQSFVIAVLAVVIPMSAARRRLPAMLVIAGILIFLVIIIPFNQAYRSAVRGGSVTLSPSEAIAAAPGILRQTLTGHGVLTVIPDSVIFMLQRVREIDAPAIILQRTPGQIPFSSPAQLAEAPIVEVVPRALWPGKPILATGYKFSQQYYGLPPSIYTSSAITPMGDLYRHGGWVPLIGGMLVLGCGLRLLDDVLDICTNPHAIFLVLLLFPTLVKGEDDWLSMVASLPAAVLLWLVAVALTFRRRRLT